MSNRAAIITQADVARIIRAAKQAGAAEVELRVGTALIVVRMESSTAPTAALEQTGEIVL